MHPPSDVPNATSSDLKPQEGKKKEHLWRPDSPSCEGNMCTQCWPSSPSLHTDKTLFIPYISGRKDRIVLTGARHAPVETIYRKKTTKLILPVPRMRQGSSFLQCHLTNGRTNRKKQKYHRRISRKNNTNTNPRAVVTRIYKLPA